MEIVIDALVEHPDIVAAVARWCHREWGHLAGSDSTLESYATALREWINNTCTPTMFAAFDGSAPVGCVALTERDPATRMDLGPWLAALYVIPSHRGRNVGIRLVRHLISQARGSGVGILHAAITDKRLRNLALRHGWRDVGRESYQGRHVMVMALDLGE